MLEKGWLETIWQVETPWIFGKQITILLGFYGEQVILN